MPLQRQREKVAYCAIDAREGKRMKAKIQLGEVLIQKKLISQDQLNKALRIQVSGNRRLGYLLTHMGLISDDQLIDALAKQLDLPVITIDDEFSPEVKTLVPRYLCRKYSVLPLRKQDNKILTLAMIDPLDAGAISSIENYTGLLVEPSLARRNDLTSNISRKIPLSRQDIINQQNYGIFAKIATALLVSLFIIISIFTARYVFHEKYGTISVTAESTVYKNHDLLLGVDRSGEITLLGRGARATGYYYVSFKNLPSLQTFLTQKKNDFSEKQTKWLNWVINKKFQLKLAQKP